MIGQRGRVKPIKRVEEPVREGEHQFRQLTETLPQLVWTCTPEGDFDYLNPQFAAYTGVPTEEHLGSRWIEQVHPGHPNCAPASPAWAYRPNFMTGFSGSLSAFTKWTYRAPAWPFAL
jgi:PAS domain-containing protein